MAREIVQITLATSTGHTRTFKVEVIVDLNSIAKTLGRRAVNSKGQKAIACNGDVVVRVLE